MHSDATRKICEPEVIDAAYQALKQFGMGCGTSAMID